MTIMATSGKGNPRPGDPQPGDQGPGQPGGFQVHLDVFEGPFDLLLWR